MTRTAPASRVGGTAARRRAVPALPIGLAAVAVFGWWAARDGGAAPTIWYPGALLLLPLLVVVARRGGSTALPRAARWALAALAAFAVWSFASIAWADARGDAWDAANRALLYLTVFALFAALPWRPAEAAGVLAAFALAVTAAGMWAFASALEGSVPAAFADGRLVGPVGYENASAALLLAAFWPALMLAAERSAPRVARGVLLAAAGVLMQLVVLAQSRGSVAAAAVSLALAVLLHEERGRLLAFLGAVAITTAASLPALLRAYAAAGTADVGGALVAVAAAMAVSGAVLFAAGLASVRLDGRGGASPLRTPGGRRLAAGVAVAVVGAAFAAAPDTRLTAGAGSGRYDFWRVAAGQLADHPLQGAGAGNFAHDYAEGRRRREEPLYPHSIILGSLGHTGLVGASLLAGFLAAAFAGLRRLGGPDDARRTVGLVAVVSVAAWLTQASIDWLWELPALTAPAVAFLGLVAGLGHASHAAPGRRLHPGAGVALACAAAGSYALPALAARDVERGVRTWDDDASAALAALGRARDLNPLTDRPDVIAAALALRDGDRETARRSFERAVGRDGRNWYAQAELGLLELEAGETGAGRRRLAVAKRLNPLEPAIGAALDAARNGGPVPGWVRARLSELTVPGPLGRRSLDCRPVLGLGADCEREDAR